TSPRQAFSGLSAVDIGCFLHTAGRENFNAHLRDELLNGEIFYTLRRVASCATLTDSAGHAGATENLTFHLDHSAGAISLGHGSGRPRGRISSRTTKSRYSEVWRKKHAQSPGIALTSATTAWRRKATSSAHRNPRACRTSCTR